MESETDASEERLSNTTGRLVQLEREVGLLRQNNREVDQLADRVEWVSNEASQNAEEAQQVLADTLCLFITASTPFLQPLVSEINLFF